MRLSLMLVILWAGASLALDVGPETELAPGRTVLGPGWGTQTLPNVAPFNGGFMVVWEDRVRSETRADVYLQRFDRQGVPQGAPVAVAAGTQQSFRPAVACHTSACLVVWMSWIAGALGTYTVDVLGARFDLSGTRLDAVPLTFNVPGDAWRGDPAVASDGVGWLTAWTDQSEVFVRRIDANGVPVSAPVPVSNGSYGGVTHLAYDGQAYVVAWSASSTGPIFTRQINPSNGALSNLVQLGPGNDPRVSARPDGGVLVVWHAGSTYNSVRATRMGIDGGPLDPSPLVIGNAPGGWAHPSAAWNGENWVTLWANNTLQLGRNTVSTTGTFGTQANLSTQLCNLPRFAFDGTQGLLAGTTFPNGLTETVATYPIDAGVLGPIQGTPVYTTPGSQTEPAACFHGTSFITTYTEVSSNLANLVSVSIPADGSGSSVGVSWPATTSHRLNPSLASNPAGVAVSWREIDTFFEHSAHVATLSSNLILGPPVALQSANVAGAPSLASAGNSFLAVWPSYSPQGVGALRFTLDAGQIVPSDAPGLGWFPTPTMVTWARAASAPASGVFLVTWFIGQNQGIRAARIGVTGAPLDGPAGISIPGPPDYSIDPQVSSDGRDFLVVWPTTNTPAYAARVTSTGVVTPGVSLSSMAAASAYSRPTVTFDGVDYLVTVESESDAGNDVWVVRVAPDGGFGQPSRVTSSSESEERASLAVATTGRTLLTYQRFDPVKGNTRVYTRLLTQVPNGGVCLNPNECASSTCVASVCGGDAGMGGTGGGSGSAGGNGSGAGPAAGGGSTGGTGGLGGGGTLSPLNLRVTCGCASTDFTFIGWILSLLALRGSRRSS